VEVTTTRLLTKDGICAYLGGISAGTYDTWQRRGLVPGPVPGTTRYDVKAHDRALDRISGLDSTPTQAHLSPLDRWEQDHAA
jgi:hypothetical protein